MRLATELLQMEFLREQLASGQGLTCIFDVLDNYNHTEEDPGNGGASTHRMLLEDLWATTALDPDRDQDIHGSCTCARPSRLQ